MVPIGAIIGKKGTITYRNGRKMFSNEKPKARNISASRISWETKTRDDRIMMADRMLLAISFKRKRSKIEMKIAIPLYYGLDLYEKPC
jgi:hypothetical protein